jgi:flagellar P-ring protein precursor FlgI
MHAIALLLAAVLGSPAASTPAAADAMPAPGHARIGDITRLKGMRDNDLFGTGLVVGLNDTGDSAKVTKRALANLLAKHSIDATAQDVKDGSAALVMVTARLPPFAKEGDRFDVTVSILGDAESLFGGTLLFTPLTGADGTVWATAQGALTVGGFAASGDAASVNQNHPTVGTIRGGAIVEEELPARFVVDGAIELRLADPDFETARRIAEAINQIADDSASTVDPAAVTVKLPMELNEKERTGFIARLQNLVVRPHTRARVIVNERSGTIVAGEHVRIGRCAIAHGNLTVTISEAPAVSQPAPLSEGETTVVPRTDLRTETEQNGLSVMPETTTIGELAAALNALGAAPRDLIAILQALSQSGALHAELEVH